jgi:hypothetical protein
MHIIDQLWQDLPERFHSKLIQVRQGLPLLFREGYPLVINHDDLLEMNIHVDVDTGHIAGIVDWAEAYVSPFGLSLGGLENIIGVQTSSGWRFHPQERHLREHFWNIFYTSIGHVSDEDRQAIEIARLFGLFRDHGFDRRPEKPNAIVVRMGDLEFTCLEALCLR